MATKADKVTQAVLKEVQTERWRQDRKWGQEHDDKHLDYEWGNIIRSYMHLPGIEVPRENFVKAAAVAIAAIETLDRRSSYAQM